MTFDRKGSSRLAAMLLAAFALSAARAEIPSDFHVQSDEFKSTNVDPDNLYAIEEVGESADFRYIRALLEQEYPVRSIILHAVSRGMTISDVAYLLTLADVERTLEFYNTIIQLMPYLPEWACDRRLSLFARYDEPYPLTDLGPQPTIRAVADQFFEDERQLGFRSPQDFRWRHPDWLKGESHMLASVDELIEFAREDGRSGGDDVRDGWWYAPGASAPGPGEKNVPVFVALYQRDKKVVVDAPLERLEALRASRVDRVPIIFVYNAPEYIPTFLVPFNPEQQGQEPEGEEREITIRKVADRYFGSGLRVTPPREWHVSDYHIQAKVEEIDELFELPEKADIDPARWRSLEADLRANGFFTPLLVTLYGDSKQMWADDEERVVVAASLGMREVPAVFLYHEFNRLPCGIPAACEWQVYDIMRPPIPPPEPQPRPRPPRPNPAPPASPS